MLVRISDDGSTMSISFQHITQGIDRRTMCRIIQTLPTTEKVVLSEGVARCSQKDIYSKEAGRMLSLTRALESFDKEFRTQAWDAYWHRGENAEAELVAAYVPDAELYSAAEAQQIAERRDEQAAQALADSAQGL